MMHHKAEEIIWDLITNAVCYGKAQEFREASNGSEVALFARGGGNGMGDTNDTLVRLCAFPQFYRVVLEPAASWTHGGKCYLIAKVNTKTKTLHYTIITMMTGDMNRIERGR